MSADTLSVGSPAATGSGGLSDLLGSELSAELVQIEQLLLETLSSRHAVVQSLANRAAAMGGKRLRPLLVLLFSRAVVPHGQLLDSRRVADCRRAAAAVELVHAASLVHDDVMDHAIERRHQPTIGHVCGNSQAVLLGDFLFTRAYAVAAECSRSVVARELAATATRLCEGELRQQASAGNWRLSYRDYRSILNQKTGALIGTACYLGTAIGRGGLSKSRAAYRFGTSLGLAFQIFDDWLDYWGENEAVGKTLGTDLEQFKPTLPLMRLMRTADRRQRHRLVAMLSDVQAHPAGVATVQAEIRRALDRSDAQAFTLAAARRCVERAKHQLRNFPASKELHAISSIADFSVQRKA